MKTKQKKATDNSGNRKRGSKLPKQKGLSSLVATILYDRKYQNTQNSAFNAWCRSFFKALGLEEPKDIKKTREVDFDARITKLMNFLPKEDFA